MKLIYNCLLPFKGFKCINLFGLLFVRREYKDDIFWADLIHEGIHTAQMRELGYVFFYVIYFLEWIYRLIRQLFTGEPAYRSISFEKEAYANQNNIDYLTTRKHYSQWNKI